MMCLMKPKIPKDKICKMILKINSSAYWMMFGVTKDDRYIDDEYLGSKKYDWSMHLHDGNIHHD